MIDFRKIEVFPAFETDFLSKIKMKYILIY
jgi:hypothetical protein